MARVKFRAERWLKTKANEFESEAARGLHVAADHYTQIAEDCMKDLTCPWDPALGPNRFDDWTSELRSTQITRLEAAREHDRAAINAIQKALEVME
ncbi:MAG: hypothetical protein COS85_15950 [Armatimonadetes bacterium CG07_land_8_20_14_0_80_59_28]|nr:MAG: hypothetical protein COS85_15950 [Armatimonadetes bacterium CG07_land_8_20_14_0_80_59_28]PIX39834.1 MAG: hypothetical protein COZ56_16405 [Armatimonadetes bacterium CG_4_8_14_3_um_filter_58_9]PJB62162.1 MAG: hypothetical protein CO095_19145 [Armatimonadetes bacterium CG_4_9_14_3_um_filter_58_7]